MSDPPRFARYLPVLTKLTQSPWFLNFLGIVKSLQPPFLHWLLFVGGPIPTRGVMATPTGLAPTAIVAEIVFVDVSITKMELAAKLATYAWVPSGVMATP